MQFIVGITGVTAGKLLISKLERFSFKKKVMGHVFERRLMPALIMGPFGPPLVARELCKTHAPG